METASSILSRTVARYAAMRSYSDLGEVRRDDDITIDRTVRYSLTAHHPEIEEELFARPAN
jgi:hypothetical protein